MQREPHWQTRSLHDFIAQRRHIPFAWGTNDCCLFAADAIQAMTGVDIAADVRGKYWDAESAFALIRALTGGTTVADAVAWCAAKHGLLEREHPLTAQRGDVVVIEDAGRLVAGIVGLNGRDVLVPGETKLKRLSIVQVKRAWKV